MLDDDQSDNNNSEEREQICISIDNLNGKCEALLSSEKQSDSESESSEGFEEGGKQPYIRYKRKGSNLMNHEARKQRTRHRKATSAVEL